MCIVVTVMAIIDLEEAYQQIAEQALIDDKKGVEGHLPAKNALNIRIDGVQAHLCTAAFDYFCNFHGSEKPGYEYEQQLHANGKMNLDFGQVD